jgi:WD40 repeat protein
VLVVDEADQVTVWDGVTGRPQASWPVGAIYCCALSPDADLFATGHERGRVEVWDAGTGERRCTLIHLKERTTALAFSPNGCLLAAASLAGPVTVWEGPAFRKLPVLSGHPHSTYALAFSPDGRRLATGSQDREAVKLWDTVTWQELITLEAPGANLRELAFTADGTRLIGRTDSGELLIWHAPDREEARTLMDAGSASGQGLLHP